MAQVGVSPGTVVRFRPVSGVTPKSALDRKIWLPCLLGDFEVDEPANITTYDTLSAGQFSQEALGPATARQLRTGQLSSLTIDFEAPWLVVTGQDQRWLRARLYEILRAKKPVHMLIQLHPDTAGEAEFVGTVQFTAVNKVLKQGEHDTRYLTITFQEWRDPLVKRRHEGKGRKKGVELPTTHKLRTTDTLHSLSKEFYGTYSHWRNIRDANGMPHKFGAKTLITKLGGHFKVGYKIKIPKVTSPRRPTGGAGL